MNGDDAIEIRRIGDRLVIIGTTNGIEILAPGTDLSRASGWPQKLRGFDSKLARCVPVLVSNGQLEITGRGLFGSYGSLADLDPEDADVFDDLCAWSPFSIHLDSFSSLGAPDFRIRAGFSFGDRSVHPRRCGGFLELEGRPYRVEESTRRLLDLIIETNGWPENDKVDLAKILTRWGEIRGILGKSVGVDLDRYLVGERVVIPESLHLDLQVGQGDSISVVPTFDRVPDEPMHRQYLRFGEIQPVYNLEDEGGRLRVVIRPEVGEALRAVSRMRRLRGRQRERVLANPRSLLHDSPDGAVADLSRFGPRVRGIGQYPASVRAFVPSGEKWTEIEGLDDIGGVGTHHAPLQPAAILEWIDHGGVATKLPLATRDAAACLRARLAEARSRGEPTIEHEGVKLPTEGDLVEQLEDVLSALPDAGVAPALSPAENANPKPPKGRGVGVLVYENLEGEDYAEALALGTPYGETFPLPAALKPDVDVKPHQREGILWLQRSLAAGQRNGVLLADDMGLGKTLQVLAFLAWVVESPYAGTLQTECGPYDPILVVAPVVLLEDLGWRGQIERFLETSCFLPFAVLHGAAIRELRTAAGAERHEARPLLDLDRIRCNRLIITSYETLVNYQLSLTSVRWSVVVSDEAHVFKDPDTKVSFTMKALDTRFRVALTGTPVQNRMLDLWNLVDYLQPGSVLGSAREFRARFEQQSAADREAERARVSELRRRLGVGRPDGLLLRRNKEEHLPGLPAKTRKLVEVDLGEVQRQLHLRSVQSVDDEASGTSIFALLSSLSRVCQHPALVGVGSPDDPVSELLGACPKLEGLLGILREVKRRGEKALVFAFFRDAQAILKRVIDHEFDLDVDIMNGDASRSGGSLSKHRSGLLRRFADRPGFNVLILSPKVAGVGLTIVEANHVIHYGRWWNPAIEDQATDRVHRIGQEREVCVYNLVARDPAGRFRTFDEKLDALIERKRTRAADFLRAREEESALGEELFRSLRAESSSDDATTVPSGTPSFARPEDILALSSQGRRCVIATLQQREGRETLLTPKRTSRGIDVVAVGPQDVLLIRVRGDGESLDHAEVGWEEVLRGADFYRGAILPDLLRGRTALPCFAVLEEPSRQLKAMAEQRGVTLLGGSDLIDRLRRASVSIVDASGDALTSAESLDEIVAWTQRGDSGDRQGTVPSAPEVPSLPLPEWLECLLASETWAAQCRRVARQALAPERTVAVLAFLGDRGGKATRAAIARQLAIPEFRVTGLVATMRRVLNVDGYDVLGFDTVSDTIELNVDLLRMQFGL